MGVSQPAMLLFMFAALITAAVVWALARPLLARLDAPAEAGAYNAAVYRDQLDEIARDVARGTLGEAEADAARTEVERRLLAAAQKATEKATEKAAGETGTSTAAGVSKLAAGLVAGSVIAAAAGVYLLIGAPAAPDQPLRARADAETAIAGGDAMHGEMDDLVRKLDAKLKENPEDPQGWALMARSLARLERNADALAAYQRAVSLTKGADGALMAEYAEMRIIANDGVVDAEAEGIFARMLREEPGAPQARFYLALAKTQRGDAAGGLADWRALLSDSPLDAPWRPTLEARIAEASGGPPPLTAPPPPTPSGGRGPTAADVQAAGQMSDAERTAMIEGMVAQLAGRLKETPGDVEGWRRLARAYDVLGRGPDAARAHERVLALAPNDPNALWQLGLYAQSRGDKAEARRRWQALERALPANAPERAQVRDALAGL